MDEKEENLKIVHVPALVAVLLNAEREKGSALSEQEVLEIRDSSECIVMPFDAADKVEKQRGYPDIDPEYAWEEWQVVRDEFSNGT